MAQTTASSQELMARIHQQLLAWARLARVANWPSAASNILAGFLVTGGNWEPVGEVLGLLGASLAFFAAGMILNDWHDWHQDRQNAPDRPLVQGLISRPAALWAAIGLMVLGVGLAGGTLLVSGRSWWSTPTLPLCGGLIAAIWLYDVICKSTWFAPLFMGGARALNLLLGASLGLSGADASVAEWKAIGSLATLSFAYVAGLTWLARRERDAAAGRDYLAGGLVVTASLVAYALFWSSGGDGVTTADMRTRLMILMLILAGLFAWRWWQGWQSGRPEERRLAIILALRNLILLDAAICYGFSGGDVWYPSLVAALVLVSLGLQKLNRLT